MSLVTGFGLSMLLRVLGATTLTAFALSIAARHQRDRQRNKKHD